MYDPNYHLQRVNHNINENLFVCLKCQVISVSDSSKSRWDQLNTSLQETNDCMIQCNQGTCTSCDFCRVWGLINLLLAPRGLEMVPLKQTPTQDVSNPSGLSCNCVCEGWGLIKRGFQLFAYALTCTCSWNIHSFIYATVIVGHANIKISFFPHMCWINKLHTLDYKNICGSWSL